MKLLFAVSIYSSKLHELWQKYYKSSRVDKFYTWGSSYYYKIEAEIDSFIANEYEPDKTYSYYIVEIGRVT